MFRMLGTFKGAPLKKILFRVLAFMNVFVGTILSFNQYKNHQSCQALHTGSLPLITAGAKVQEWSPAVLMGPG